MFDLIRNNDSLGYYNPFLEMEEFEKNAFGNFFKGQNLGEFKTDVMDEGDKYVLEADLPGFEKKDIELGVNGNMLTIKAERRSNIEEKDKDKIVRMERSYGSYKRSFDIEGIDVDKITAKYDNGVLKLNLPKIERALPEERKLEIE